MLYNLKRVVLGSLSVLGISMLIWIFVALNPNWVYAHQTQIDFITIHHNEPLEAGADEAVKSAIEIIKKSDLYCEGVKIDLCLNDDSFYPKINPLVGKPLAYAMLDKTILYNCVPQFEKGVVVLNSETTNFEDRIYNLSWLLAHEFTHNLQFNQDAMYVIRSTAGKINWKLEGHAEYVSRLYKGKNDLKQRIETLKKEEIKENVGFPVFQLEDGTSQLLNYYKYAIIIQYLLEEENLNYQQVCEDKRPLDELYSTVIEWSRE